MEFYSHYDKENDSKKLLTVHLNNVKKIANKRYKDFVFPEYELSKILEIITTLHDFGKFTTFFQDYLLKNIKHPDSQHSLISAVTTFNKIFYSNLFNENSKKILISSFASLSVLWHHGNLKHPKFSFINEKLNDPSQQILEKQKNDLTQKKDFNELIKENIENLNKNFFLKDVRKFWHNHYKGNNITEPEFYFLFNYIFSLLIEADKLDASETEIYELREIPVDKVDNFVKKLPQSKLSELRNNARKEIVNNVKKLDLESEHLFTLSAPTGIGKTLTAFDFAIKLRKRLADEKGYKPLIIYALPFINIIEQTYNVFKNVLGDDFRILAHYQFADVFSQFNDNYGNDELDLKLYHKNLMSLDTWQADIVITTFVQFFKTLITGKNRLLKKFNHLAGSIIIIDEIQTLPLDMLPLLGAMLYYLTKYLKSYVVVMTATQPGVFKLSIDVLLQNIKIDERELLLNNEDYFNNFERTKIISFTDKVLESEEDFVKFFKEKWSEDKSALVVVNTINRSIKVYKELKKELKDFPIYYLSTNITPLERDQRVKEIKEKLESGEKLILVSTQVVEAGVDLDFDMAFRDIGPLDSIIQVAGRVNRNNRKGKYLPVYVVYFKNDARIVYGIVTEKQAKQVLNEQKEYLEKDYKNLVKKYFNNLANRKSFDFYKKIYESIKKIKYEDIEDFEIIKDDGKKYNIFVEIDVGNTGFKAKEVLDAYKKMMDREIKKAEFDAKYKLAFNQRVISVSLNENYFIQHIEPFLEKLNENYYFLRNDNLSDIYNYTGLNRDLKDDISIYLI